MMKINIQFFKALILFAAISTMVTNEVQAQLNLPAYSPRAEFSQDFALTNLTIGYGRPGVKDRKIFGEIIPAPIYNMGQEGIIFLGYTVK